MSDIADSLTRHHRRCDELLAAVEEAAHASDWARYRDRFNAFAHELERHFEFEEQMLFPAFEQATGMRGGPTMVMRAEHDEVRALLAGLAAAAPEHDPQGCLAEIDTLFSMLQQHNVKEEGVLYPACDQMLGPQTTALAAAAEKLNAADAGPPQLDLRGLSPPEPMERILNRLQNAPREQLRARMDREPFPLYELLRQRGFRCHATALNDGSFEVVIEPAA